MLSHVKLQSKSKRLGVNFVFTSYNKENKENPPPLSTRRKNIVDLTNFNIFFHVYQTKLNTIRLRESSS